MPIASALPGRTHCQGEISQVGKHISSERRYIRLHNTKQAEKNTAFRNDTLSCRKRPIPTMCTSSNAAAVDTACARGSVLLITQWYTSLSTYMGTVCLSKRTYRYLHEARMNVLYAEHYHTTYCWPGWSPACAQTKRSLAIALRHR